MSTIYDFVVCNDISIWHFYLFLLEILVQMFGFNGIFCYQFSALFFSSEFTEKPQNVVM